VINLEIEQLLKDKAIIYFNEHDSNFIPKWKWTHRNKNTGVYEWRDYNINENIYLEM